MLKAAQDLMAANGLGRGAQTAVLIAVAGAGGWMDGWMDACCGSERIAAAAGA